MENYRRLRKLGSGNFAKVHLAVHIPTKTQVSSLTTCRSYLAKIAVHKVGIQIIMTKLLAVHKHFSDVI